MRPRPNHAQHQIRAVILHRPTEDLLIGWDCRRPLDAAQRVDRRANGEVANALDAYAGVGVVCLAVFWSSLDGDFGEADADGADVAAEDVTSVESFTSPDGIVEALEIDWK